jgi:hypothetical protein
VALAPSTTSASDAALDRYRARMRRSRTVYYAILAVAVAAIGTWVGVAWSRGEVAHASLHTIAPAPPTLSIDAPTQRQTEAWRSTDHISLGYPQWGGTVVVYSAHTVGGRDARTGKQTWTYTRTDRAVCTAVQLSGTTIAIYANHGNCDEVSSFDSGTGRRRWTRTLDVDGMPVNGRPSYQFTASTLLVSTPAVIYAIDPVTGYNRWTYQRFGCRIDRAVLGGAGALISQTCGALVHCKGLKFCGRGPQLLLRDGSAGRDDDKPNADKILWNLRGDTAVPVSADDVLSAVDRSGEALRVLDPETGKQTAQIQLSPPATRPEDTAAFDTDSAEIIWISGQTYALPPNASTPQWQTASDSPPVVMGSSAESTPNLGTARITVPLADGIGILDGNDGQVIQHFSVPAPPPDSVVYSLGTGFLVAAPSGIVAYR